MKKNNTIYIYTDGSCLNNQTSENKGGYGVYLKCGKFEKKLSKGFKNTTNNIMEMLAVIEGLKAVKDKSYKIIVFSDSAYIVNCINDKWYVKWQKNNWINSKKEPVLNKELWQELLELYTSFDNISFIKVKGHLDENNIKEIKKWYEKLPLNIKETMSLEEYQTHIKGNNIADKLAVESSKG